MLKVSELTGAQLDYWVARAEGVPDDQLEIREIQRSSPPTHHCIKYYHPQYAHAFDPSSSWAKGGPIIERESIAIFDGGEKWGAEKHSKQEHWIDTSIYDCEVTGPTPLIAAMRAFVLSKLGSEVEKAPVCGS